MHILVTHGSKRGGTAGIAEIIGSQLREAGHTTDVVAATSGPTPDGYGAVIVGGALYANQWTSPARRFVKRHAEALRERPVWFFSSGPLDDSASKTEIPPVKSVARLMALVRARGHATFGGRLAPDARGFVASRMAKTHAGDWRDPPHIRAWTAKTAELLHRLPAQDVSVLPKSTQSWPGERSTRRSAIALCLFAGLTACAGGFALALSPDGSFLRASVALLRHAPFASFLVPGILLGALVGIPNLIAAAALASTRRPFAETLAFMSGALLTAFIGTEMLLLRSASWLQLLYLIVGLVIVVQALKLRRRRDAFAAPPPSPRRASVSLVRTRRT
jgi:menaquinone-dependent protoporphyrinogen oxidase